MRNKGPHPNMNRCKRSDWIERGTSRHRRTFRSTGSLSGKRSVSRETRGTGRRRPKGGRRKSGKREREGGEPGVAAFSPSSVCVSLMQSVCMVGEKVRDPEILHEKRAGHCCVDLPLLLCLAGAVAGCPDKRRRGCDRAGRTPPDRPLPRAIASPRGGPFACAFSCGGGEGRRWNKSDSDVLGREEATRGGIGGTRGHTARRSSTAKRHTIGQKGSSRAPARESS